MARTIEEAALCSLCWPYELSGSMVENGAWIKGLNLVLDLLVFLAGGGNAVGLLSMSTWNTWTSF